MTDPLDGSAAWVIGGGSGIGRATALILAQSGARVAVTGRRAGPLRETVAQIQRAGGRADALPADVLDARALAEAAAGVRSLMGEIDILVYSAGTNVSRRWWSDLTVEDFDHVVQVNLTAATNAVLTVLPAMRTHRRGTIVIVSSWAGWTHSPGAGAAYSASKAGLGALVATLNDQEGRHGVRACHLCPGEVATDILRTRPDPPRAQELDRMLRPDDVAAAVLFVAAAPDHVCVNELVVSPTWNRSYIGDSRSG